MAAYAQDCVFADPFVSFQGTDRWVGARACACRRQTRAGEPRLHMRTQFMKPLLPRCWAALPTGANRFKQNVGNLGGLM